VIVTTFATVDACEEDATLSCATPDPTASIASMKIKMLTFK
jgi:hypothetical protein